MTRHPPPVPVEFEPEFIDGLKRIFEEKIVFNQVLGLKITSLLPDRLSYAWQHTERFGLVILLLLLFTGVIGWGLGGMTDPAKVQGFLDLQHHGRRKVGERWTKRTPDGLFTVQRDGDNAKINGAVRGGGRRPQRRGDRRCLRRN